MLEVDGLELHVMVKKLLKHLTYRQVIYIYGETASSYLYLESKYENNGEGLFVAGKVTDECVRFDGHWKMSNSVTDLYSTTTLPKGWAVKNPHHLSGGLENRGKVENVRGKVVWDYLT